MARKNTAPRIGEKSAEFYAAHFPSLNAGLEYCADAWLVLYRQTMRNLRGKFSRGELMLLIDVFNSTMLTPRLAGQQIGIQVADGIALDRLDKKWEIDGAALNARLQSLSIFEAACLEVWANGFWRRSAPEDPLDIEAWILPVLGVAP